MPFKTYKQAQDEIYSESLTENLLELGEDHECDAHANAHEDVWEWSQEFPESTYDPLDH